MNESVAYAKRINRRKFYIKLGIFFVFSAILGGLIITSFYTNGSLTGFITEKIVQEVRPNSTIEFNAELTIPSLSIDGNFQKVELRGNSESFLDIESERFSLNSKSNYITIENYTGEISFDGEKISKLKGKATRIFVNGIPIQPKTKGAMKVSLGSEFYYSYVDVKKEVVIKEMSYSTSGEIIINNGKNIFNLENEKISIEDFVGDLKIFGDKFNLDGFVKKLDIRGKSAITISS